MVSLSLPLVPLLPSVLAAMQEVVCAPGNPASLHRDGQLARRRHEQAAAALEAWVLAPERTRVVFTGSGAEANWLAILGFARALVPQAKRRRIVFDAAMPAQQTALSALGFDVTDNLATLADDVALLVLPANRADVRAWALLARQHGIAVHLDATRHSQPLNMMDLGVDSIALTGTSLGGPSGVGALLVRQGLMPQPLWEGGGQEFGLRPGTPAVALTVGMGAAARHHLTQTVEHTL